MKQALTNIIRNQCKFLTPEAKANMTVFIFNARPKKNGFLPCRGRIQLEPTFMSSLATAEKQFVLGESHGLDDFYIAHKDEKIFEAKTYGDRLVIAMED